MKYYAMSACVIAVASLCGAAARADVLAYQGFEGDSGDSWAYTSTGSGAASNVSLSTDYPSGSRIGEGAYSYQSNNTTSTLVFSTIQLDAGTTAYISIPVASISLTSGNGNDTSDYVAVFVSINGAAFSETPDLKLTGYSNAKWSFSATGIATTTIGEAAKTVNAPYAGSSNSDSQYGTIQLYLPENTSSVALKIIMVNDNAGEIWATDGISLISVPEAGSLSMLTCGGLLLSRRIRCRKA